MSVDYYLYSPSTGRRAQVGSIGLGGVQSYPGSPDVVAFIRLAIELNLKDVRMVNENELEAEDEKYGRDGETGEAL